MRLENRIKELRLEGEMSREELSFLLDVCKDAIASCENGKRVLSSQKLIRLTEIFGVPLTDLLEEKFQNKDYFYF